MTRKTPVYLLDLATYKPPEELKADVVRMHENYARKPGWKAAVSLEATEFLRTVRNKSGLSPTSTYIPRVLHPAHVDKPMPGPRYAKEETQLCCFGAVQEALRKSGVRPKDVDIVVTSCSVHCSTPSLASMLVNRFKMRTDVEAYHLGGMGCGNGVIGIKLCRDMLKAHPNSICLFVVTENVTAAYYGGEDKQRLVANAIFRMGATAVLLTNKKYLKPQAKYKLVQAVSAHTGADDESFRCMDVSPDEEGHMGITLSKEVVYHASKAVASALRKAIPKMLTLKQWCKGAINRFQRKCLKMDVPTYVPDLSNCCQHFVAHAGSGKVVDGLQHGLGLSPEHMVPSNASLREYGNTSGSTTWYALTYIETFQGLKKGERVMQIGIGSGVKAGVNIWESLHNFKEPHPAWAYVDCVQFERVQERGFPSAREARKDRVGTVRCEEARNSVEFPKEQVQPPTELGELPKRPQRSEEHRPPPIKVDMQQPTTSVHPDKCPKQNVVHRRSAGSDELHKRRHRGSNRRVVLSLSAHPVTAGPLGGSCFTVH